ncbi:PREDICTED: putative serine carboxypeptidase-like 52 [Ipomoea nil]|uniref:putative serine carboxypeptidase-like 52 n=1 Tax=Ipomoea nil TaxID=35883 RepID=UPI0009010825|nr:PREDICTED: putative serine carboxypeptidase-like 52 [Ipomoea nil]
MRDQYINHKNEANKEKVDSDDNGQQGTMTEWLRCNHTLSGPPEVERSETYVYNVKNTVDYHRSFTNKSCRVLVYSGNHDMIVPHVSTEEWIESLKVSIEDEWRPWFVEDQVAGYAMKYSQNEYELAYATVKGAGHTAPEYKPQQCQSMIQRWLSNYPL